MTNYEKIIKKLPIEALAKLLIKQETIDEGYFRFDGEEEHWEPWEVEYYRFQDALFGTEYEAYEAALEWLNQEVNAHSLREIEDIQCASVLPDWSD